MSAVVGGGGTTSGGDPIRIPVVDLPAQYRAIRAEVDAAVAAVLARGRFILGPEVEAFEAEMADYCGVRYAVGVGSGTDALFLALKALGIKEGDEVITTPFSFVAAAGAIGAAGARPVFADIDPGTFTVDPAEVEARITPRTRAVVPVHLYGHPAAMDEILAVARAHHLAVIEDNAQAIGARYRGRRTGSLGEAGCLSFYPTKNLGAYGDGGMVTTDSPELAERIRRLRDHGTSGKYRSEEQGYNSRLDEIQAAVLRVKLRHLDAWAARRRDLAATYGRELAGIASLTLPVERPEVEAAYHQYTVRVRDRDRVQACLAAEGIATAVHYPIPLHLQGIFQGLGLRPGSLPRAEAAAAEVLSLPMYPELTDGQAKAVGAALRRVLGSDEEIGPR